MCAFAVEEAGLAVDLKFALPAGQKTLPLKFRAVAITDGLPQIGSGPNPRRLPQQIPYELSDRTIVSRGFEF